MAHALEGGENERKVKKEARCIRCLLMNAMKMMKQGCVTENIWGTVQQAWQRSVCDDIC